MSEQELEKWHGKFRLYFILHNFNKDEDVTEIPCRKCGHYKEGMGGSKWGCAYPFAQKKLWYEYYQDDFSNGKMIEDYCSSPGKRDFSYICAEWVRHV